MVEILGTWLNLANGTIIHQNYMNLMAESYGWTGVVLAVLDISDWPKDSVLARMMMIFYDG